MARLKVNILLPALALVALGAAGSVAYVSLTGEKPDFVLFQPHASIPKPAREPDADTPADTIRRLHAEMAKTDQDAKAVIAENKRLQNENARLRNEERTAREKMRADVLSEANKARAAADQNHSTQIAALTRELADLRSRMSERLPPVSLTPDRLVPAPQEDEFQWLQPMDKGEAAGTPGVQKAALTSAGAGSPAAPGGSERIESPGKSAVPYFTIPPLASLISSTSLTAIIGRVPKRGRLVDPVPFRVLVGRDNLAASGLFVPEAVFGMVFEGTAVGDYALECTYGNIDAATFIFQDGTIRSVRPKQGGGGNAAAGNGNGNQGRLAYVADRFGTPCISGELISNADSILAMRVALTAAEAAAQAAAAAQTTTTTGAALGTTTTSVTGDLGPYIAGKTAAGGFKEIDKYFADRLNDIFDAVFVPAGRELAIMVQQEITLDYEPNGRKLDYGAQIDRSRSGLD